MDIDIGNIITIVIAFGVFYGATSSQLARLSAKVDELKERVEKHNNVIERTFHLESDMTTAFKRVDELKEADQRILDKLDSMRGGA